MLSCSSSGSSGISGRLASEGPGEPALDRDGATRDGLAWPSGSSRAALLKASCRFLWASLAFWRKAFSIASWKGDGVPPVAASGAGTTTAFSAFMPPASCSVEVLMRTSTLRFPRTWFGMPVARSSRFQTVGRVLPTSTVCRAVFKGTRQLAVALLDAQHPALQSSKSSPLAPSNTACTVASRLRQRRSLSSITALLASDSQ
mmetsp:Transcript_27207/g.74844  ORF Transcript_27207/g.74844 Transcript_27207/m.74844 type:complete len:202 (-) Transcript_27207:257-862(-)